MKYKNEIIKYNNDLQSVNITNLTKGEFKIWMYLLIQVRDKQAENIKILFSDIKNKVGLVGHDNEEVLIGLKNTSKKLLSQQIVVTNKDNTQFVSFTFFNRFKADSKNGILEVQVNNDFLYIVNAIIKNYSVLHGNDIKNINSKYSMQLYKKIKEFHKTEKFEGNFETFKKHLGVENKTNKFIRDRVLKPIEQELPKLFSDFKLEKIKRNQTSPIEKIIITGKAVDQNKNELANFHDEETEDNNLNNLKNNDGDYLDGEYFKQIEDEKEKSNQNKNDTVVSQNEDEMF